MKIRWPNLCFSLGNFRIDIKWKLYSSTFDEMWYISYLARKWKKKLVYKNGHLSVSRPNCHAQESTVHNDENNEDGSATKQVRSLWGQSRGLKTPVFVSRCWAQLATTTKSRLAWPTLGLKSTFQTPGNEENFQQSARGFLFCCCFIFVSLVTPRSREGNKFLHSNIT